MKHFELTHTINDEELENRLEDLAQRCKPLNAWSEKDLLQYTVSALPMEKIWLDFLEDTIVDMEESEKQKFFLQNLSNRKNS